MIKLFRQDEKCDANFFLVHNTEKATHFRKNGGAMTSISKLTRNKMITNKLENTQDKTIEEPLQTMNVVGEEKAKEELDDNVLNLPAMDFSIATHEEHQQELEMHTVEENVLADTVW